MSEKLEDTNYNKYTEAVEADITAVLKKNACQPILFVGSGLSRRYFNAPSWGELLTYLQKMCPLIEADYTYYKQKYEDFPEIGELFTEKFHEWAWGKGKNQYSADLFTDSVPKGVYIKQKIVEYLIKITPKKIPDDLPELIRTEIDALTGIRPHAIITTNYDKFLEVIFPDYHPVIGQQILSGTPFVVGEIFKIHGCVSDAPSLVFTKSDYEAFAKKKKYLSAKLLTFFSEHPLVFLGYGLGDPNIKSILKDLDEALGIPGTLIENIYFVEWRSSVLQNESPPKEYLVDLDNGRSVRVKLIVTSDFKWVYKAFGSQQILEGVSPKILRSIVSRSYHLVRHDIPRRAVQANFEMLENAVKDQDEFVKLFGLTTLSDPTAISALYKYTISQLATELGFKSWQKFERDVQSRSPDLFKKLKSSDNVYHRCDKYNKSLIHKYSEKALQFFREIIKGNKVELKL